jgi:hypothetical protein
MVNHKDNRLNYREKHKQRERGEMGFFTSNPWLPSFTLGIVTLFSSAIFFLVAIKLRQRDR